MGNISVSDKVSKQISESFFSLLMESVTNCSATSDESFLMEISAGRNIKVGKSTANMKAIEKLSCIASEDSSALLTSALKQQVEASVKEATSGIATGANVSIDLMNSTIVNELCSENTISSIQTTIANAKESFTMKLDAGEDVEVEGAEMIAEVDEAVSTIASEIQKTIAESTQEVKQSSKVDELVDGFMSGSTFTKIAYIVVAGTVIAAIIAALVKILRKDDPNEEQYTYMNNPEIMYDPYTATYQPEAFAM